MRTVRHFLPLRLPLSPVLLEERFSWIRCGDAAIRPRWNLEVKPREIGIRWRSGSEKPNSHLFEVREWRTNIVTVGV